MSHSTHDEAVLLVGHGSRDLDGVQEYLAFAEALQRDSGCFVQASFLEFNEPAVLEGVRRCVDAGATRISVLPLFLGPATHQKNDVPAAMHWARARYPEVSFAYGTPLGTHALLAEALAARANEAIVAAPAHVDSHETAILLVGRGSHDPDSNADVYKTARLLYEGRAFGWVEASFIAISAPDLPAGIDRCVRLGANHVVLLPYMLFTGTLVKRIPKVAARLAGRYPDAELLTAAPLGAEPNVLQVVRQRLDEARAGTAHANCDACKYRLQLTGFEGEHELPQGSDHHHGLRGRDPAESPALAQAAQDHGLERGQAHVQTHDGVAEPAPPTSPPAAMAEEASGDTPIGAPPPTAAEREQRRQDARQRNIRKGLVIVNTGSGKGKTTAAIGLLTRAWGRNLRTSVIQFLKHEGANYGEVRAAKRMGIRWRGTGDGWTWTSKDLATSADLARHGWTLAQQEIAAGETDVLVLDEFTYPLHYGWLDTDEVIVWLRENKPPMLHVVITGRHAPQALVDYADLVTEMRVIKHPFQTQGIRAQPGIEF